MVLVATGDPVRRQASRTTLVWKRKGSEMTVEWKGNEKGKETSPRGLELKGRGKTLGVRKKEKTRERTEKREGKKKDG